MKAWIIALAMCGGAIAPALAQCPASAVQDMVNLQVAAAQSPVADIAGRADALSAACANEAYVQKAAASVYATLQARETDPAKAFAHASKAWERTMRMRDVQPPNEKPVSAMAGAQPVYIRIFSNDGFDRSIHRNLFAAELKSGLLHPEHQPLKSGEKLRACRDWDSIDAADVMAIVRENPKTELPAALNYFERLSAICAAYIEDPRRNARNILAHLIKANYTLVNADPKRPGAKAMLDKAVTASARFFQLQPSGDLAYWSTYDRDRLAQLATDFRFLSGDTPKEDEWFKGDRPDEDALVVRTIADKLDAAWAIDQPKGVAAKFQTYRGLIQAYVYDRALKSANPTAAKRAVALAAQGHAAGKFRKPETKSIPAPPDYLWVWIDKDVQPIRSGPGYK